MKNSNNISINIVTIQRQLKSLVAPIIKHRTLIVILIALISIIAAVYKMEIVLTQTQDEEYTAQAKNQKAVKTQFDQDTIEKIQELQDPQTSHAIPDLPGGRINPFTK